MCFAPFDTGGLMLGKHEFGERERGQTENGNGDQHEDQDQSILPHWPRPIVTAAFQAVLLIRIHNHGLGGVGVGVPADVDVVVILPLPAWN